MTDANLITHRLKAVEDYIDTNKANTRLLEKTIHDLNVTITLLNQTVMTLQTKVDAREASIAKALWVGLSTVITAAVVWLIGGGLTPPSK